MVILYKPKSQVLDSTYKPKNVLMLSVFQINCSIQNAIGCCTASKSMANIITDFPIHFTTSIKTIYISS